jgi:hypothetical protein
MLSSNTATNNTDQPYPIGEQGKAWGGNEKALWLKAQVIQRSYAEQVLDKLLNKVAAPSANASQSQPNVLIPAGLKIVQYNTLAYSDVHAGASDYPVYLFKSQHWDKSKPSVLVTGGVHGYETSGVHGVIRFLHTKAINYCEQVNFIIVPCLSPWGYETINRWNPLALDPNRAFIIDAPAHAQVQESQGLIAYLATLGADFSLHIDLHETTDSDNSQFRPALAARDATSHDNWNIPDGFYLVGDTLKPQADFQAAVISAVKAITHIAPADDDGRLIGVPLSQEGVINYATKALGLCAGVTDASYCTTTEVYPDSPFVDDENCILAQVAAITSALDYVLGR